MIRPAMFLSASLLALPLAARAQAPAATTPAPAAPSQLDRIEGKLDEVLRWLDQTRPQSSGTVQGTAAASGAAIPSPAPSTPPTPSPEAYKPGALAIAHVAPSNANGLSDIPPDSVGGFGL